MTEQRLNIISEALYTYSASDLNALLLQDITLEELFYLSSSSKLYPRAAFRAAWALEHILQTDTSLLIPNKLQVIRLYIDSSNWSVLRSISKLIMTLNKEQVLTTLTTEQQEHLLEKTFTLLSDSDCPIAVRCNVYDILYAFATKEEWIQAELKLQIQFDLEKNSTAALKSRGLRIINKLNKLIKS